MFRAGRSQRGDPVEELLLRHDLFQLRDQRGEFPRDYIPDDVQVNMHIGPPCASCQQLLATGFLDVSLGSPAIPGLPLHL